MPPEPVKNRRPYTIFLLAALALMQVRVAFAACDMGQPSEIAPLATYCGHSATAIDAVQQAGEMSPGCEPVRCVEAFAAQDREYVVLPNGQPAPPALPPREQPYSASAPGTPLQLHLSASPRHVHPSLIYVFGRLLI